jgi:hypothetical protein
MVIKMKGKFIDIAPGVALPEYFVKILEKCEPVGVTKKLIKVGDPLKLDYIPPYVEMVCEELDSVVTKAKSARIRVYRGRKHITS